MNRFTVFVLVCAGAVVMAADTASQPAVDPAVKVILDRMEKTSDEYLTLKADIDYKVEMRMTGEVEQRTGWVAYQKKTDKTPDKFRIHFDLLRLDEGRPTKSPLDYTFDGYWLTISKHNIKSMTKIEVARSGDKVEPLKIGKGPFPVPFGQKTADMLEYLEITTRPAEDGDPAGTSYLKLIPRAKYKEDLGFRKMELWVDDKTNLPVKVVSRDKNKNVTTAEFRNIKTGDALKEELFAAEKPAGWDLTVEKLGK